MISISGVTYRLANYILDLAILTWSADKLKLRCLRDRNSGLHWPESSMTANVHDSN